MGPIIWYPEPRCVSMGKRPASVPVADVSKAVHDRRFPQQQIITQLQNFRDKVTMMNHQLTDLQHSRRSGHPQCSAGAIPTDLS
ncbi:hypothetical protein ACFX2I_043630 [Malus domestica]